jgi:hypothetical protein
MPPAPRRPRQPRAPRLPPLRLSPVRSAGSVELDQAQTKGGDTMPPFVRWDVFIDGWEWRQGEHITTIGPTGSGKTVLNRELLLFRSYVIVLGVKNRDPELYGPFERQGYELVHHFEPEPPDEVDHARVLFVPQTSLRGPDARKPKARAFRSVLNEVQDVGYWCVYCDDVMYMADQLKLAPDLEELWILGRSEGVSVVASSQEPVNIPVMAYGMATHLFLFTNKDRYRARRMAELTGVNRDIAEHAILNLPPHEFLYINKNTGRMLRSKVIRR